MKNLDGDSGGGKQLNLTEQAVIWLKKYSPELVLEISNAMGKTKDLNYSWLPQFLRKVVAKDMLDDLITRFESNTFDNLAVRDKMLNALKKGATAKSIEVGINLMVSVINQVGAAELKTHPQLLDVIITKTNYVTTLMKSNLASAVIEFERFKINKK